MYYYAGIDVSLECSSVCVVDGTGKILREAKVASEPEALIAWFRSQGLGLERIGLEAGPLSQWLYFGLGDATKIDNIEVDWPSGRKQVVRRDLEVNQTLRISEPSM